MQDLYCYSLNSRPKIRNRSGETSKRGDDKRVSLARKPLLFRIKNGRKKRSIFLQKKKSDALKVSFVICASVYISDCQTQYEHNQSAQGIAFIKSLTG